MPPMGLSYLQYVTTHASAVADVVRVTDLVSTTDLKAAIIMAFDEE